MDWDDLSAKAVLMVIIAACAVAGSGQWWLGVLVVVVMAFVYTVAAVIQRHRHGDIPE